MTLKIVNSGDFLYKIVYDIKKKNNRNLSNFKKNNFKKMDLQTIEKIKKEANKSQPQARNCGNFVRPCFA